MEIVSRMMDLYARIDKAVAEFQLKSVLRCPLGCGNCCPFADMQVTVLKCCLSPAQCCAARLRKPGWNAWPPMGDTKRCLLYTDQPASDAARNCGFYKWRPALCQLFGYTALRNHT